MPFCKKCGNSLHNDAAFCPSCGAPASVATSREDSPDMEQTRPRLVDPSLLGRPDKLPEGYLIDGRYRVKSKLGQGGFGAVYLVEDRKLGIDKALKVIPEAVINDPEALEQLRREARVMLSLNHPNIVRVYDFHDEGPLTYIDMEYVPGRTLTEEKLRQTNRKLAEDKVREYARKIAAALMYAHERKILHKDLKPQNVMVTAAGEVKVMDFGIAETVRSSLSRLAQSTSSGTLVYMSPEQLRGREVGKESDIYSFGALLYDLLCGHPPFFRGQIEYQILNEEPEEIVGVSQDLNVILKKCLAKDYKERYRSFGEVRAVLEGQEAGESIVENISQVETTSVHPVSVVKMVLVKGGRFQMGSTSGHSDETPVHMVTVRSFYMDKTEVTQAEYRRVMGKNLSYFSNCEDCPVERVSWYDAVE